MLHSLNELIGSTIDTGDGGKATLTDAFFDDGDAQVRYVALDIGGWLNIREVIVRAERLRAPQTDGARWSLAMSEDDLSAAPRWSAGGAQHVDLSAWPPIVVGPFGGTHSPILLYEQAVAREDGDDGTAAPRGDTLVRKLEQASAWMGLPAFGAHGAMGKITDLAFEPATMRLHTMTLSGGGGGGASGAREVPLSALRYRAEQGTHVVLSSDALQE